MTVPSPAEIRVALTAPGQPFEMEEVVVRGVPLRTWKHAPPTLAAVLSAGTAHGDADFLVYADAVMGQPAERWSFARHGRTAARFAHLLRDRFGVQKGDRVAVAMRNLPEWPVAFLGAAAAGTAHGDADFLVYADAVIGRPAERWSFARHGRTAAHLAHVLRDRFGVRKGDRVAIAMRNLPEWPVAFLGAAAAGAVVVPLNAWWTGPELQYGLADSGSVVLVCDAQRFAAVTPELASLPVLRAVIVVRPGSVAVEPFALDFDAVIGAVPDDVALPDVALEPEDDATIFYTSGTTGRPKGAVGTHRNITTNLVSLAYNAARTAARSDDPELAAAVTSRTTGSTANLISVPFFHVTGCHSILLPTLYYGGKLVLMRKWDAGRALELIEQERITNFGGVPTIVWQVLDHPDFARRDLSSVRSIAYGGAPAAPELVRHIEALLPGRVPSNGYGLTETSAITAMNSGPDYQRKPESVGLPVAVVDVQVVGSDGQPEPVGSLGELWVRGPNVVKGYFGKPAETAATFSDGWLHTGDIARIDDEGFVSIVDRAKDIVIRGGENVYCVEVESVLHEHEAVSDAAVIGLPHPVLGEEVGAVVQIRHGADVSEEDLRAHVAARLSAFKVPVRIWLRSEPLPRNPAGKILKRDLREELSG